MGEDRDNAEFLFSCIGEGRENAVTRPREGKSDRHLRNLVERANKRGEIIINVGGGYYRPRPWVPSESAEFNEYIGKEESRARQVTEKIESMKTAFSQMKDGGHSVVQKYEQLSLPV